MTETNRIRIYRIAFDHKQNDTRYYLKSCSAVVNRDGSYRKAIWTTRRNSSMKLRTHQQVDNLLNQVSNGKDEKSINVIHDREPQ